MSPDERRADSRARRGRFLSLLALVLGALAFAAFPIASAQEAPDGPDDDAGHVVDPISADASVPGDDGPGPHVGELPPLPPLEDHPAFVPSGGGGAVRPIYELPFPCGEQWQGATYSGHGSGDRALDLNRPGDDGDPVVASAAGTAYGYLGWNGGYGNYVLIDHGGGYRTLYAHLSAITVASGTPVTMGQQIGNLGTTGNSTGPHLHYEQHLNGVDFEDHVHFGGYPIGSAGSPDPGYSYTYNGPIFTSRNNCAPPPTANPPAAPAGLVCTAGPGTLTLAWDEPLDDGGAPINDYEFRLRGVATAAVDAWTSTGTDRTTTVGAPRVQVDVAYEFRVRASNSAGQGPASPWSPACAPNFDGPTCDGRRVTIDMNTNGGTGIGTPGNDVIRGTAANDVIDGLGGDDLICAGGGNDVVYGRDGRDRIFGQAGVDTIYAGNGDDKIYGGADADLIVGGGGNDLLIGNSGNDEIQGNGGADRVYGNDGSDDLSGNNGDDRIFGNADNDIIRGDAGDDGLYGHGGRDAIYGGDGNDVLVGASDADWLYGQGDTDTIRAGSGDDLADGGSGAGDTVVGNSGDDQLIGGNGDGDTCRGLTHVLGDTADISCENTSTVP